MSGEEKIEPKNGVTLQTFQGLQPGQQVPILIQGANGQLYQFRLLESAPATASFTTTTTSTPGGQPSATFRMQTVAPATPSSAASSSAVVHGRITVSATGQNPETAIRAERPATDKEKCYNFLSDLLKSSSKVPKAVARGIRKLIQELIDKKIEPGDFCDKLGTLLNDSAAPHLEGFLKKSLPLLRHSLATNELSLEGIRPPSGSVVSSVSSPATHTQTQVRPALAANQVEIGEQDVTAVRPEPFVPQQCLVPTKSAASRATRVATVRQPIIANVVVSNPQQPALRPVYLANQVRANANIRQPMQMQAVAGTLLMQGIRLTAPANVVSSMAPPVTPTQTLARPGLAANQVKILKQGVTAAGRPLKFVNERHLVSLTGQAPRAPRVVTQQRSNANVIVSNSQQPAFQPVFPGNQVRTGGNIRQPIQNGSFVVKVQGMKPAVPPIVSRPAAKEKKSLNWTADTGDDDINDVAAMGGVNLSEEKQKILESTKPVGTQIRSCKENILAPISAIQQRMRKISADHGLEESGADVAACLVYGAEERLKNLMEKLSVIVERRLEPLGMDQRYEATNDVKAKLEFLANLDRAEHERHQEEEREKLLRVARSRTKTDDPELAKLKAQAKEMQRMEMEERRQREANAAALQAIGPRKKTKLEGDSSCGSAQTNPEGSGAVPLRQRMKTATLRDLQFTFERDRELSKSKALYMSYFQ